MNAPATVISIAPAYVGPVEHPGIEDLHPFVEAGVIRTGTFTVRHELVCCSHRWVYGPSSPYVKAMAKKDGINEMEDKCVECGTECLRDVWSGQLIALIVPDVPEEFPMPPQRQAAPGVIRPGDLSDPANRRFSALPVAPSEGVALSKVEG